MTDLTVEEYSEKALVVRGETQEHKEQLKELGGKWNARLRGGGGWIFSKKKEADVMEYISSGNITAPDTKPVEKKKREKSTDSSKDLCRMEKKIDKNTALLEKLIALLKDGTVVESDGESSEEEAPRKRLLK